MCYLHWVDPSDSAHVTAARIVAVDDERENLELLERTLARQFSIATFTDSDAALGAIASATCQVLFTDVVMPKTGGVALARRAREVNPHVVIVALSAYTDSEEVLSAFENGLFDLLLRKPWKPDDLRSTAEQAFHMSTTLSERPGPRSEL